MKSVHPFLSVLVLCVTTVSAADAPTARDFDWLSGHWCGNSGDAVLEEVWMPPAGDLALGAARVVKGGRTVEHEFLRIEFHDGAADFVAILPGQQPTPFRLTASGEDWARFENPQHDFPRRIEYRRTSSGLHAEIAGPGKDGREQVMPFEYRRCVD
jgi:uncharacterized protein DUF6265